MPEKLLKITYHGAPAGATKKLNAYLKMPSQTFTILRREIEIYLFQERQLTQCEIKTYWIDGDCDEIEIFNQYDYEIFLSKCQHNMHLQIAAASVEQADEKPQEAAPAPADDDPTNFIIHDGVQCDSCGLLPMIGFRYKCVQCPNFDLCQKCETAHKHADHLMVRMPNNNGPSVIDAWLSGPGSSHHHRRLGRRSRGQCPFVATPTAQPATPEGAADTDKHYRRRHSRRNTGILSQFVDMMINMPETNGTPAPATAPAAENPTQETKKKDEPSAPAKEPTVLPKKTEEAKSVDKPADMQNKPINEEPIASSTAKEPLAAPRANEQPKEQAVPPVGSTPTTPVISLENLAQMVNPEYMRAGIEILNNFSEMFAKMIDPSEAAAFGCADTAMSSNRSTSSRQSESGSETQQAPSKPASTTASAAESLETNAQPSLNKPAAPVADETADLGNPQTEENPEPISTPEPESRQRSESLDQDWQMIDNNAKPISTVSSTDALINLNLTEPSAVPAPDFVQLGEVLRKHVIEENQREQSSAQTQTSQVNTVSTSTSTSSVATNNTSTSTTPHPPAPEDKRHVPIYHNDERINASVHAMMAMGFSNEGAWLTQLLESVDGNIPAALDIMHTSQSGRN